MCFFIAVILLKTGSCRFVLLSQVSGIGFFVLYFLLNTWNWNLILHVTTIVLCLISRCFFHVKAFSVGRGGYRTGGYRNDAYWSCCGNHVSKGHICPIKVNK